VARDDVLLIGALLVALVAILLAARSLGSALAAADREYFTQRRPADPPDTHEARI
jgi:hypothetical protein